MASLLLLLANAALAQRAGHAPRVQGPVAASVASADGPMDIYILMGQSNMSGRGDTADLTRAERAPDPSILLYGNDGGWRDALDPLDDAAGQVDQVSADPVIAAVGPGLFFARALLGTRPGRIGLVPCAKGGSTIAAWSPGTSRETLYGSCLARAREATKRGRIAGILWYQGESATGTREGAARWAAQFTAMIAAFRRDLRAPSLPLVVVGSPIAHQIQPSGIPTGRKSKSPRRR